LRERELEGGRASKKRYTKKGEIRRGYTEKRKEMVFLTVKGYWKAAKFDWVLKMELGQALAEGKRKEERGEAEVGSIQFQPASQAAPAR
jgi:hypothetical protein